MGILKCIIIDDDDFSVKILEKMIEKTEFLEFSGFYNNPIQAIQDIDKIDPDIIFLDVEMPEMSGFEVIKAIGEGRNIILSTSSEKHAYKGFGHDVVDYLLKPIIEYSRFLKAVLKAKTKINSQLNGDDNFYAASSTESIFIKQDSVFNKVLFEKISWIEAFGDYIKIKTKDQLYTVYSTMSGVEQKLPQLKFVRVHRSFIVNIDKIDKIDQSALQIKSDSIPIGNSYRKKLLASINML